MQESENLANFPRDACTNNAFWSLSAGLREGTAGVGHGISAQHQQRTLFHQRTNTPDLLRKWLQSCLRVRTRETFQGNDRRLGHGLTEVMQEEPSISLLEAITAQRTMLKMEYNRMLDNAHVQCLYRSLFIAAYHQVLQV